MEGKTILAILVSVLLLVNACALGFYASQPAPVAEVIEVVSTVENTYNDTTIKNDLAIIKEDILAESNWESTAIDLATEEMEEKDYRNVFNALIALGFNNTIIEKEDIDKVSIRDSDVTSSDDEELDATVVQELKVYFEDVNGTDMKVYLDLVTEIVDGEVDDDVYTLTVL